MLEPKVVIKDGIAYYERPYVVNFIQFGYEHLDCDSIISGKGVTDGLVEVVAYSTAEEFNTHLYEIFNTKYVEGYCILQQISSMEAASID